MVSKGIAFTIDTVKNRQDLFDPFFDNKRKGWWQKGNAYLLGFVQERRFRRCQVLGDGYDFQIQIDSRFVLIQIKGLRSAYGSIRLTEKEFSKAQEYKDDYGLVVVGNLEVLPKMRPVFNLIFRIDFQAAKDNA